MTQQEVDRFDDKGKWLGSYIEVTIKPPKRRFIYPDYGVASSEYGGPQKDPLRWHKDHNGQFVTVVRRCTKDEFDYQGEAMFIVRADDGTEGQVWRSELHSEKYPWPNTHDQNGNRVCPNLRTVTCNL